MSPWTLASKFARRLGLSTGMPIWGAENMWDDDHPSALIITPDYHEQPAIEEILKANNVQYHIITNAKPIPAHEGGLAVIGVKPDDAERYLAEAG